MENVALKRKKSRLSEALPFVFLALFILAFGIALKILPSGIADTVYTYLAVFKV